MRAQRGLGITTLWCIYYVEIGQLKRVPGSGSVFVLSSFQLSRIQLLETGEMCGQPGRFVKVVDPYNVSVVFVAV